MRGELPLSLAREWGKLIGLEPTEPSLWCSIATKSAQLSRAMSFHVKSFSRCLRSGMVRSRRKVLAMTDNDRRGANVNRATVKYR